MAVKEGLFGRCLAGLYACWPRSGHWADSTLISSHHPALPTEGARAGKKGHLLLWGPRDIAAGVLIKSLEGGSMDTYLKVVRLP